MSEPKLNRLEKLFKIEAVAVCGDVQYIISDSRSRITQFYKGLNGNKFYKSVKIFCGAQELTLEQLEKL